MDNENKSQRTPVDTPEEQSDLGQVPKPRGNPDSDPQEVDRGEEKLDQIVGN